VSYEGILRLYSLFRRKSVLLKKTDKQNKKQSAMRHTLESIGEKWSFNPKILENF